jgi:energy-coupling factor transport system ATP-binding protein
VIHFEHVSYTYPEAVEPILQDLNFSLPGRGITLVAGPSGSGKSTLLRCINGLVPHFSGGILKGTISVDGLNPVLASPRVMSAHVGFVFQHPEAQFVMDRVEDELVFSLENAAIPRPEILNRVDEILNLLNLTELLERSIDSLSGGEKQLVAISAALVMRPKILVLDEPTSQLSPEAAKEVLSAVARINEKLGITVVLAEHRLERLLPFIQHVLYLSQDEQRVLSGTPREVFPQMASVPPMLEVARALSWDPLPVTIEQGQRFSRKLMTQVKSPDLKKESVELPYIKVENVSFAYAEQPVLRNVSCSIRPGEVVALMGHNGAGKTTLLKCLVGLIKPSSGSIRIGSQDIRNRGVADICREVGYLPQDPNALLFADSVEEELLITLRNHRLSLDDAPISPRILLERLGLETKMMIYPRDLSVGERQRVALGAIMITQPNALLLDEPTRGLDYEAKNKLGQMLSQWCSEGLSVLLVTHDVEFAASVSDRVLLMDNGEIVQQGSTFEVMNAQSQYATQITRLFPGSGWLTPEQALVALQDNSAL